MAAAQVSWKRLWWGNADAAHKGWQGRAALAGAAFVLAQALIYRHPAPFVWIYLMMVWMRRRDAFLLALGAAAAGAALAVGISGAAALTVLALAIPGLARLNGVPFADTLVAAAGPFALFLLKEPLTLFPLVMAAVAGIGSAVLYGLAQREINRLQHAMGDGATLVMLLAMVGALIAGLEGWQLSGIVPGVVVGGFMVLAAAAVLGPAAGALAGATLGLTLALRDPGGAGIGMWVAGGFVAGWLAQRHWRLAAPGLWGGVLAYAVLVHFPAQGVARWASVALPAAIFVVLPGSLVAGARQWVQVLVYGERGGGLAERMRHLAQVMEAMAQAFHGPEAPVEEGSGRRLEAVTDAVCRHCSLRRTCWEEDYYPSYRAVSDLLALGESRPAGVDMGDLRGPLARRCIHPGELLQAVNRVWQDERQNARLRLRLEESRRLAERQLRGIAALVGEMANDPALAEGGPPRLPVGLGRAVPTRARPVVELVAATAARPRAGSPVSGDSFLVRALDRRRQVFALSDGMGVGARAAWESGTAVALVEQLLLAGFSTPLAVKAVNTTLLLRNPGEDQFATLDLLLVNRADRTAELLKVAAVPTFLLRAGRVEVIGGGALPVGILPELQVEPIFRTLEAGDVLVMVTDGVVDNADPEAIRRLQHFLERAELTEPKVLAEAVLSYMLGHAEDGRDDAACLVVRVVPCGWAWRRRFWANGEGGPRVTEWQRLTTPGGGRRVAAPGAVAGHGLGGAVR